MAARVAQSTPSGSGDWHGAIQKLVALERPLRGLREPPAAGRAARPSAHPHRASFAGERLERRRSSRPTAARWPRPRTSSEAGRSSWTCARRWGATTTPSRRRSSRLRAALDGLFPPRGLHPRDRHLGNCRRVGSLAPPPRDRGRNRSGRGARDAAAERSLAPENLIVSCSSPEEGRALGSGLRPRWLSCREMSTTVISDKSPARSKTG